MTTPPESGKQRSCRQTAVRNSVDKVVIKNAYMDSATGELFLKPRKGGERWVITGRSRTEYLRCGPVPVWEHRGSRGFASTILISLSPGNWNLPAGTCIRIDFVIRADVVAYNGCTALSPPTVNGHVHPKTFSPCRLTVVPYARCRDHHAQCAVSGAGQLEIDWGDNSDIRDPSRTHAAAAHPYLRQQSGDRRRIRWFTDACSGVSTGAGSNRGRWYWSVTPPVEELTLTHATLSLESLRLLCREPSLNLSIARWPILHRCRMPELMNSTSPPPD